MNKCTAITQGGTQCSRNKLRDSDRCRMHLSRFEETGPNKMEIIEFNYVKARELREIQKDYIRRRTALNPQIENYRNIVITLNLEEDTELATTRLRQNNERNVIKNRQRQEILRTGINPDAQADVIRRQRIAQRQEAWELREQLFNEQDALRHAIALQRAALADINPIVVPNQAEERNDLRILAADRQNIHTTLVVQKTKEYVDMICRIHVPPEYRWNMNYCSKTIGEIIIECNLTPRGAWQMAAKYCVDDNIYELGLGIYGKVLDSVWQYVKASTSKDDLCKIIRQEMEDNIGMCAQGNLSRLCNILSGYLEGIGSQESLAERLGRLLPPLSQIEDANQRLVEVLRVLTENGVPNEEWLAWAEPLFEEIIRIDTIDSIPRLIM